MNYQRDFDLFRVILRSILWLSFPDLTDVDLDSFQRPIIGMYPKRFVVNLECLPSILFGRALLSRKSGKVREKTDFLRAIIMT